VGPVFGVFETVATGSNVSRSVRSLFATLSLCLLAYAARNSRLALQTSRTVGIPPTARPRGAEHIVLNVNETAPGACRIGAVQLLTLI